MVIIKKATSPKFKTVSNIQFEKSANKVDINNINATSQILRIININVFMVYDFCLESPYSSLPTKGDKAPCILTTFSGSSKNQ